MQFPPASYRQRCDPPADKLVQQLYTNYGDAAARKIYLQLVHTFDLLDINSLPKEITQFYKKETAKVKIEHPEKLELASDYFQRFGHAMFLVLICKCLPQLYTSKRGVKTLYETGYLLGKDNNALVARRLMETAQFYIDILYKGAYEKDGYGFFAATKVRIIHAYVRKFMWDKNWNEKFAAEYDQPVCQEDMMGTLMAFSVCMIDGIRKMGLKMSEAEADAIVYTWHITGKLLGVDDKYNPDNFADGRLLFQHLLDKEAAVGVENVALTKAILDFMRQIFTPSPILKTPLGNQNKLPELLVTFFVGRKYAPYIGLEYHQQFYYKNILRIISFVIPNIFIQSRRMAITEDAVSQGSGYLVAMIFRYIKKQYKMEFRMSEDVLRDWKLDTYLPDYGAAYAQPA